MKSLLTLLSIVFVSISVNSQTLYVPDAEIGTSSNSNVGIGTSNPQSTLSLGRNVANRFAVYEDDFGTSAGKFFYGLGIAIPSSGIAGLALYGGTGNNYPSNTNMHLFIKNNGFIGIGTYSPLYKTHIKGNLAVEGDGSTGYSDINLLNGTNKWHITGPRFGDNNRLGIFYYNGGSYTDCFTILPSGNVGIGTSTPGTKLDVIGDVSFGNGADGSTSKLIIKGPNSPGDINSKRDISYEFFGAGKAIIRSYRGASWDTYMQFLTSSNTNGGGEPIVRMHINGDGNVGIGTSDPNAKLTLVSAGGLNTGIYIKDDYTNPRGAIYFNGTSQDLVIDALSAPEGDDISTFKIRTGSQDRFNITRDGNVLIGKTSQSNTNYKLDVEGSIRANEVVINTDGADFVFDSNYKLRNLSEVESFIKQNKHLPDIASAEEMQNKGVGVSELQTKLLQKVEELTLYMIEQNKNAQELLKQIQELKKENENLKNEIKGLK